jgi:hypothetical protein
LNVENEENEGTKETLIWFWVRSAFNLVGGIVGVGANEWTLGDRGNQLV